MAFVQIGNLILKTEITEESRLRLVVTDQSTGAQVDTGMEREELINFMQLVRLTDDDLTERWRRS